MKEKEKERNPVLDTADQAMRGYEHALRTGLKLQEETWQCWHKMLSQSASGSDWQKQFATASAAVAEVMPVVHKRVDEALDLMEKNTRQGAELIQTAVEASQAGAFSESQAKWMDFWKSSLGLARSNTEAAMLMNSKVLEAWVGLVQRTPEFSQPAASARRG